MGNISATQRQRRHQNSRLAALEERIAPSHTHRSAVTNNESNDIINNVHVSNNANQMVTPPTEIEIDTVSSVIESESSVIESSNSSVVESLHQTNEMMLNSRIRTSNNQNTIFINDSNGVHVGDRIIYNAPVSIIHNHIDQNQLNSRDIDDVCLIDNFQRSAIATNIDDELRIVSRDEWFAQRPQRELELLELPAIRVIIAHTANNESAKTHMDCVNIVQNIQDFHMQGKNWDDIGYNFLIGGDGSVYVGRGWFYKGAHSRVFNQRSICIAFIGNFWKNQPSQRSLISAQRLIEEGVKMQILDKDYRLYGA